MSTATKIETKIFIDMRGIAAEPNSERTNYLLDILGALRSQGNATALIESASDKSLLPSGIESLQLKNYGLPLNVFTRFRLGADGPKLLISDQITFGKWLAKCSGVLLVLPSQDTWRTHKKSKLGKLTSNSLGTKLRLTAQRRFSDALIFSSESSRKSNVDSASSRLLTEVLYFGAGQLSTSTNITFDESMPLSIAVHEGNSVAAKELASQLPEICEMLAISFEFITDEADSAEIIRRSRIVCCLNEETHIGVCEISAMRESKALILAESRFHRELATGVAKLIDIDSRASLMNVLAELLKTDGLKSASNGSFERSRRFDLLPTAKLLANLISRVINRGK